MKSLAFVLSLVALLLTFSWTQITEVLANRPTGESLLNPFDSRSIEDFNLWFVLMQILLGVYGTMAWQNNSAYNSAALTPHESRMSGVLGRWREMGRTTVIALLAVCAVTFLAHPDFAAQAQAAVDQASTIADPQARQQMSVPIALSPLLPLCKMCWCRCARSRSKRSSIFARCDWRRAAWPCSPSCSDVCFSRWTTS